MDNLTHTAVGLFLARAGLNRLSPYATPILLVAANAPDADIVTAVGGASNYLHFHRHITHSFLAMPVMAAISIGAVWLGTRVFVKGQDRKPIRWGGAFVAALVALLSHFLLDWTNVYGIRMLLPFSGEWLRIDTTSVVDPWLWSVCLLGVAGPFLAKLVGSEISSGASKARHHGRGFAWFALLFFLAYDGTRYALHERAVARVSARMYEDAAPTRAMAIPFALSPFRWRGVVETQSAWFVDDFNLLSTDGVMERPLVFRKPDADPAMDAARRSPAIAEFLRFTQAPLWRVTPWPQVENGKLVEVIDMRFGTPLAPTFAAKCIVNGRNEVVESDFHYVTPGSK